MTPEARIVHRMAGRLRIKIPSKKGDYRYFDLAEQTFKGCEPIHEISSNPATGGMLIQFSGAAEAILAFAQNKQLFTVVEEKEIRQSTDFHQGVKTSFNSIDRQVKGWTQGSINLGGLAFVALVGAGVYQIARGKFTAIPWYSAFWYALGIFSKSDNTKAPPAADGG